MKGIEGTTLGRYELRRRIARGGMAEVYLGYDRRVRRRVAVKVLYGSDEPFVRRFEREALAVGMLSHDHILPLFDFGEQPPWYYLVMPYIEGGTLRDFLDKRTRLTLEEAEHFLTQIASALQYAHDQGMIHRDVKPSNILLRSDGHAYLVDFGLAKAHMDSEALTHAGAMLGTPEYMAPEQSNGINDYRSDIYALGIILYQMLTGRVPFSAETPVATSLKHIQTQPTPPRELNSAIPQSIEDIILKTLAKDPNERYQQAKALSDAYQKALQQTQASKRLDKVASSLQDAEEDTVKREIVASGSPQPAQETKRAAFSPATPVFSFHVEDISTLPQLDHHRRRPIISPFFVIVLFLLLAISIPLGIFWQSHLTSGNKYGQNILLLQQTQSQATATKTARIHAQATLAAQARVQTTAGITSAVEAGNVLYSNDMKQSGGGWIDDGSQCYFSPEGYHVHSIAHSVAWCYSNREIFSDAVMTAQAQFLHGDIYGFVFRLDPVSQSFYVLEINSKSEYRFVRAQGKDPLKWLTLIDWTHSNAIESSYGQTNTFLAIATGRQFRFYINKQLIVSSFSDTNYTSGFIGLLVGGDSSDGTEAIFSNVWVFQK